MPIKKSCVKCALITYVEICLNMHILSAELVNIRGWKTYSILFSLLKQRILRYPFKWHIICSKVKIEIIHLYLQVNLLRYRPNNMVVLHGSVMKMTKTLRKQWINLLIRILNEHWTWIELFFFSPLFFAGQMWAIYLFFSVAIAFISFQIIIGIHSHEAKCFSLWNTWK